MNCLFRVVLACALAVTMAVTANAGVAKVTNPVMSVEHQKACVRELHRYELDEEADDGFPEEAAAYKAARASAHERCRALRSRLEAAGEDVPASLLPK